MTVEVLTFLLRSLIFCIYFGGFEGMGFGVKLEEGGDMMHGELVGGLTGVRGSIRLRGAERRNVVGVDEEQ